MNLENSVLENIVVAFLVCKLEFNEENSQDSISHTWIGFLDKKLETIQKK